MLATADFPVRESLNLRRCVSAGEALAGGDRAALPRANRRRHPRRHRLDGDAAHLPLQSARGRPLRNHRRARSRLRAAHRRRAGARSRRRRARRAPDPRPDRSHGLLEQSRAFAHDLPRRVDAKRRQVPARCRWLLRLLRPQRRHAQGERHVGLAHRSRSGDHHAPCGARGRSRRPGRTRIASSSRVRSWCCARASRPERSLQARSRSTSSNVWHRTSIRARSSSSPSCRRRRQERSSATSCAQHVNPVRCGPRGHRQKPQEETAWQTSNTDGSVAASFRRWALRVRWARSARLRLRSRSRPSSRSA